MTRRKVLVLHIKLPGVYADDIPELAEMVAEFGYAPDDYASILKHELREEVGVTLVGLPGDGCMSDDFGITAHVGEIVGVDVIDAPESPDPRPEVAP